MGIKLTKQVTLVLEASGAERVVQLAPRTTVRRALALAGLEGDFYLTAPDRTKLLAGEEDLHHITDPGDRLSVVPALDAGGHGHERA